MSKLFKWTGTIAVLVVILVLATTAMAAGATKPQTWFLDSEPGSEPYKMEKDGTQGGEVTVPAKSGPTLGSTIWIAKQVAETDVTFPSGDWETYLCLKTGWAQHCAVQVGSWDGLTFTPFSTSDVDLTWGTKQNEITVMSQTGAETITAGHYLALKITNGVTTDPKVVLTAGCSRLDSPCSNPGYPTPELTTGILLGIGLLGLGGFIFIKRKRAGRASN